MNTIHKGTIRYIVFKDGDTWYAVALELNVVESGEDAQIALINLLDAIKGYVESCRKVKGARVSPLNQKTDPEYERLWKLVTAPKSVPSPFEISTFGVQKV